MTKWAERKMNDSGTPEILREIYYLACETLNEIEDERLRSAVLAVKNGFEQDVERMAASVASSTHQPEAF